MYGASVVTHDVSWIAQRLTLWGRVQGVGLRPAVARLAMSLGLTGSVCNTADGVKVEIEGLCEAIFQFRSRLAGELPDGARLEEIIAELALPRYGTTFEIETSVPTGPLATRVPADLAVCTDCLAEITADANRRYDYSFTNCTSCGPRYSLIDVMPYDRQRTSMARFDPCAECKQEYEWPADRRFHAQTNACPKCGPWVWTSDASGETLVRRTPAIDAIAAALLQGRIVAVRGVGGYQLLADATSHLAVRRLRERKQRPDKPLAVLITSLDEAERLAILNDMEKQTLTSPANPIVVVRRRRDSTLSSEVCDALDSVGLMLPTTPLHWQVSSRVGRPLVCTSGNREGEPLVHDVSDSTRELTNIADLWLHHDRAIVRPVDDSVVRVISSRPVSLRLARGLTPLPLDLLACFPTLAVGGQQKAAVALSNGVQAVLGPHIGDLEDAATRRRFSAQVESLLALYGTRPKLIVHDLHPAYYTTRWAAEQGVAILAVQHHHAHAVAAMLEQGWLDREVLSVTWDGTGYGPDGTIWGGEFLLATARDYRRVVSCRPFRLPGGEAAVREPWRVAVGLIKHVGGLDDATRTIFSDIDGESIERIAIISDRPRLSPVTTSIGRLFDAVAAIVLGIRQAQFEGQPAMLLEAACDPSAPGWYPFPLAGNFSTELDWRPLVSGLLADLAGGASAGSMAMRFHRSLARAVVAVARRFSQHSVVLAGGVFQNRVLVELIEENWPSASQPLGLPGVIPPGDGGLAAGQLAIGLARGEQGEIQPCV